VGQGIGREENMSGKWGNMRGRGGKVERKGE
jgi:hypothetical protein